MKSQWELVAPFPWSGASQGIVFIRDLNGPVSVTNDAEHVLAHINKGYPGRRLVYQDGYGDWSEIVWNPEVKKQVIFRPWQGMAWDLLSRKES